VNSFQRGVKQTELLEVENLEYASALHYMHYNFARIHKTLGKTPAMAVGVTDHVWTLEEIVTLAD